MKSRKLVMGLLIVPLLALVFTACNYEEDPGPLQELEKEYALLDFDRLEMGDAFIITVQQSPIYSVKVRGDRRNLNDLDVDKIGTTLRIRYREFQNRQYATYVTITMPNVKGINFSGASTSTISGFSELTELDCTFSGASVAQLNVQAQSVNLNLSGASKMTATGKAAILKATVSGASIYSGFGFETEDATLDVSGASKANVFANVTLRATASGASSILYRGNASVTPSVSGASSIQPD